jgi:hypothetical protein
MTMFGSSHQQPCVVNEKAKNVKQRGEKVEKLRIQEPLGLIDS